MPNRRHFLRGAASAAALNQDDTLRFPPHRQYVQGEEP